MSTVPKIGSGTHGSICGRRGMPREWVERMYADYLRLKSLRGAAQLHGRSNQALHEIFKRHGFPMMVRNFKPVVEYKGRRFTPGKGGYLRDTAVREKRDGRWQLANGQEVEPGGIFEVQLNRQVWVDHHGPIPRGWEVMFLDGDKNNCSIENLRCLPPAEARQLTATGANQFTKHARKRLGLLMKSFEGEERTLAVEMKR